MKNFEEVIQHGQLPEPKTEAPKQFSQLLYLRDQILPIISPFVLSIITAPFTTASVFMQTTSKGPERQILQAKITSNPQLSRHINNGLFGDNRIYHAPTLNGYRDTLSQLGKQGIRGLYKGNLTGTLLASSNTWLRSTLYKISNQNTFMRETTLSTNLITVASCTLADLISLPLMTAQSRLILQNSSPIFRTYDSFFSVLRKSSPLVLFSGGSLLLAKNIVFDLSWIKLVPESPVYSFVISSALSHLLTYPFVTVMRQLQVSQLEVSMMQHRKQNVRACTSRLWNQGGILSFYRGFFAYSIVHLFIGAIMVQANLRSGYFNHQQ